MSHPDDERLDAFYDGELAEPDRLRLEEHLAACPSCLRRVEDWRRIAAGLFARAPAPSESFIRGVMARLPPRQEEPAPAAWRWPAAALSLAAAGLILLLAWPAPASVSAEELILEDGPDAQRTLLALAPQAPGLDEILETILENP